MSTGFLEAEYSFLNLDYVSPGVKTVESKTLAIEDYLVLVPLIEPGGTELPPYLFELMLLAILF